MSKFLRILVVLLGIVVALVLILGLVEPNDQTIQRSGTINASKEVVFDQIVKFKNWQHWSPWLEKDPTVKLTYAGTDGQVGSSYDWAGKKDSIGSGTMKCDSIGDGCMNYTVTFTEPRRGSSKGFMKVEAADKGSSKVTWSMTIHMAYPLNAMMLFIGGSMDKMLGGDFEKGLANMKKYVETHATGGIDIKEMQFPAHIYAGVRKVVAMNAMSQYFMDTYAMLGKEMGARIVGPSAALYYTWDTLKHESDMMGVFPIADTSKPVKGATFVSIPAGKAFMAVHMGGYAASAAVHEAMGKHLKETGSKMNCVIEEYIKGPHEEKDSSKWVTNIYYLVQ